MFFKNSNQAGKSFRKPRAVIFVDFEHWYISLYRLHAQKPRIREWRDALDKEFNIEDIYFFADFSNQSLQSEVAKIREVTNFIIETGNTSSYYKKDFTDFIMLDRIYQTAFSRNDVDAYIIFSGDGHFSSVVRFLTNRLHKTVGIYGVRDAVSQQLKASATWVRELPDEKEALRGYYYPILKNLYRIEKRDSEKIQYPTFRATSEAVSKYYHLAQNNVDKALSELIEEGYISQQEGIIGNRRLRYLKVNWEKSVSDGIWVPDGI